MSDNQRFRQLPDGTWEDLKNPGIKRRSLAEAVNAAVLTEGSSSQQERVDWLASNHPEDYQAWINAGGDLKHIPKRSDYDALVGGFRAVADTIGHPSQYVKGVPVLGKVAEFGEGMLPTTYVGRMMQAGEQGNYGAAAANLGMTALTLTGMNKVNKLLPTLKALPVIGAVARHPFISSMAVGQFTGDTPIYNRERLNNILPGRTPTPSTTVTSTGPGVLTPEQQQKVAEANKNRTDASGASGPGGGRNYIDWRDLFLGRGLSQAEAERLAKSYAGMTTLQWTPEQRAELEKYRAKQAGGTTAGTGATTKPAAPGLLPLTPEQIWESGQEMTAAEKAYSDLLNEQKLQKAQAQREYTQQVQGLQRQAAGQAVDIAGQMAGTGMDISPAAAFGVEQTTQAPLVAGSQQARKGLDQYMADMVAAQKKAKAARDATIMNINSKKKMWQVSNTLASQRDAYGNLVR